MTPPLITFLTFNRMGNMILSLKSLLDVDEDFDLYIIDNFSQDKTWDYLQTLTDPRIKLKHRFDSNIGGAAAVNYGLKFRTPNQSWINLEYDCLLKTKNLISLFEQYHKEFPEFGSFSGVLDEQVGGFDASKFVSVNGLSLYESGLMGFCLYIPAETMNLLGFVDEESCLQDQELNMRQYHLHKPRGYALNIPCEMLGLNCDLCKKLQTVCAGIDGSNISLGEAEASGLPCVKPYNRITSEWYKTFKDRGTELFQKRIAEKRLLCGTRFIPGSLTEDETRLSLENSEFYAKSYNAFLSTLGTRHV